MNPLNPSAVHVWVLDLDSQHAGTGDLELLSDAEKHRARAFRFDLDRARFVVRRACLRRVLAAVLGVHSKALTFEISPRGRPRLAGRHSVPLEFNTSSSGRLGVVAVTFGVQVGVDVERLRALEGWRGLMQSHCTEEERAAIEAGADPNEAFLGVWTRKEAFLKMTGLGLVDDLENARVGVPPHRTWERCTYEDASTRHEGFAVTYRAARDALVSVCVAEAPRVIEIREAIDAIELR